MKELFPLFGTAYIVLFLAELYAKKHCSPAVKFRITSYKLYTGLVVFLNLMLYFFGV